METPRIKEIKHRLSFRDLRPKMTYVLGLSFYRMLKKQQHFTDIEPVDKCI